MGDFCSLGRIPIVSAATIIFRCNRRGRRATLSLPLLPKGVVHLSSPGHTTMFGSTLPERGRWKKLCRYTNSKYRRFSCYPGIHTSRTRVLDVEERIVSHTTRNSLLLIILYRMLLRFHMLLSLRQGMVYNR